MTLSKDEVRRIARLAHLEYPRVPAQDGTYKEPDDLLFDDATLERLAGELERILEHVEELSQVDVEGIEPTQHGVPLPTRYREDEAADPLDREAALSQAPARMGNAISVPKVVE